MTGPEEPRIDLILDKSAIQAYLDGDVGVGEPISLVLDEVEDTFFGVDLHALAQADLEQARQTEYQRTTVLLARHRAFKALTPTLEDLDELLELAHVVDSVERATALLLAEKYDALVVTKVPEHYLDVPGGAEFETRILAV